MKSTPFDALARTTEGTVLPHQKVCSVQGTLLNPFKVMIRSHEKRAMVFRYLVYKGLETAFMSALTAGQRVGTATEIEGAVNPLIDKPNLPVELALRQGWELAIEGQSNKSAWFFFSDNPRILFYRDDSGDVTHCYSKVNGSTTAISKTSVSGFVDILIKEQESFNKAVASGHAI